MSFDVIVSDQQMPEMNGIEFLQHSKNLSPDTIRIMLTGNSQINDAIDSINKDEIYRYITKPWNDKELKITIRDALELQRLRKEKKNLLWFAREQYSEIKERSEGMEETLETEIEDIRMLFNKLKNLYDELDKGFIDSIRVFSNLVRLRKRSISLHQNITAKITKLIVQNMGLTEYESREVEIAAFLHDIGKICLKDDILDNAFDDMTSAERVIFMKHPILGQAAIQSIENMQKVGVIIKHQHERCDEKGYPDRLIQDQIPIGSRIITIASDYDALMNGFIIPLKMKSSEAKDFMLENCSKRYDPEIVKLSLPVISAYENDVNKKQGVMVKSSFLKEGMVIAKDLYTSSGFLLLCENMKITKKQIDNIIN